MEPHNPVGQTMRADNHYLRLLSRQYSSIGKVSTEIINLQAILNLPKGTEHFLSDIHGEYEPFRHVLKNASGVIKGEIERIYGNTLTERDKKELATLIYYPEQKLHRQLEVMINVEDWYKISLYRLIEVCRSFSANYTRSKVRKAMPDDFKYIMEELLYTQADCVEKQNYYSAIISAIIAIGQARQFIIALSHLIQRLAIDRLHIIGDIFDRGPGAEIVMETLMNYHSVDIQWGNHDILWMGAAIGAEACIANAVRISARYANLDTIENGYGINLLPLATFALEYYKGDSCTCFAPKVIEQNYSLKEIRLIAMMHKAITVIQLKLEGDIIRRHPEYGMNNRMVLNKIDYEKGFILLDGKSYLLSDKNFPTIDPKAPYRMTAEEKELMKKLKASFLNSERLQKQIRFLITNGSIYLRHNSNLLFHGCIPLNRDGTFYPLVLDGKARSGKVLLDYLDSKVRESFFERETGCVSNGDLFWYLWAGPNSPLFGKSKMATFERYFLKEPQTHLENYNYYYDFRDNEQVCNSILIEFGLNPEVSHVINGHVPVEQKNGERPIKANGKLLVIDGGLSRAYQPTTGIAGYTLIYDSYGLMLVSHGPFQSTEAAINDESDMLSSTELLERAESPKRVCDTDIGAELRKQAEYLELLLSAFRKGQLKEQVSP